MPTNDPTAAARMEASGGRRYTVVNKAALREARLRRGLTQASVATAAGCHESFYWRLEHESGAMPIEVAEAIAYAVTPSHTKGGYPRSEDTRARKAAKLFKDLFRVDPDGARASLRQPPWPLPVGSALRQAREAAGLSQIALAEAVGRHVSTVSALERVEWVSQVLAERIAAALGIDVLDAFAPPRPEPQEASDEWQRLPLRRGTRGSDG